MSWQTDYLRLLRYTDNYYQGHYVGRNKSRDRSVNTSAYDVKKHKKLTHILRDDHLQFRKLNDDELIDELKQQRIISEEV